MFVEHVARAKALRTVSAVVGEGAGKMDVFNVLVDGAALLELFGAHGTTVAPFLRPLDIVGKARLGTLF